MIINIAGTSLYRHSITSNSIKPTIEIAIEWDLDALEKTKRSMIRFGESATNGELTLYDPGKGFQQNLFDLYETMSEIRKFFGEVNLSAASSSSNSYTANSLLAAIAPAAPDAVGIWVRSNFTSMVMTGVGKEAKAEVIDIRPLLIENERKLMNELFVKVDEVIEVRDQVLKRCDELVKKTEQEFIVGLMMENVSVNYDAVEDARSRLQKLPHFDIDKIVPLPSALEYKDAFSDPRKYVGPDTTISISGEEKTVTIIVKSDNNVFAGFNGANLFGVVGEDKTDLEQHLNDVYLSQIVETGVISPHQQAQLRAENINLLSQNFTTSFRVVANRNAVVVTPFGSDGDLTSRQVALLLLEQIKKDRPSLYAQLNNKCQAVSVTQGGLDPRVALAIANELSAADGTIFGDFPISERTMDDIDLFEQLIASSLRDEAEEKSSSLSMVS